MGCRWGEVNRLTCTPVARAKTVTPPRADGPITAGADGPTAKIVVEALIDDHNLDGGPRGRGIVAYHRAPHSHRICRSEIKELTSRCIVGTTVSTNGDARGGGE